MTMQANLAAEGVADDWEKALAKLEAWAGMVAGGEELSVGRSRRHKVNKFMAKLGTYGQRAKTAAGGVHSAAEAQKFFNAAGHLGVVGGALHEGAQVLGHALLPLTIVFAVYRGWRAFQMVERLFAIKYLCGVAELHWLQHPEWNTEPATFDMVNYAIRQGWKRTGRTLVGLVPAVGQLSTMATIGRSLYKRWHGTIHKDRQRMAAAFVDRIDEGDALAIAVAAELVGLQELLELASFHEGLALRAKLEKALFNALVGK